MCEIAVYNPEELTTEDAFDISFDMFQSNSDGMGALAVYKNDGQFDYQPFAQAKPNWGDFFRFLMDSEDAWRVILHARLSTTGADNDQNTHPLEVGEGSEFEWVVHNGVVTNHQDIKERVEGEGHTYATDVDSESIAHSVESLPEDLEEVEDTTEYGLEGRLNYILCTEDGIFVRNSGKYEWTEDFTMTRCLRSTSFEGAERSIKWMIIDPEGNSRTEEKRYRGAGSRTGAYWNGSKQGYSGGGKQSTFQTEGDTVDDEQNVTEEDLADDVGAFFDEEGNLVTWWNEDNPNEKYATDYEKYKDSYGEVTGDDWVVVYEDELGVVLKPDDRVPEKASGMYVKAEGDYIEWWNVDKETGKVEVDSIVYDAGSKSPPTKDDEEEEEDACVVPLPEEDEEGNENDGKKSGSDSVTVNGVTYAESDLEMWSGHYG